MNKRGESKIVTALLIFLLLLIIAGFVLIAIKNNVFNGMVSSSENTSINISILNAYVSGNDIVLSVGRTVGNGSMTGIKIIISDGNQTEEFIENISLNESEIRTFVVTPFVLNASNIQSISIASVYIQSDGEEVTGGVESTVNFPSENSEEETTTTTTSSSGGGGGGSSTTTADTTAPTITLTYPINNSNLSDVVNLTATASDDTGVSGVTFKYNGTTVGSEDTSSPYNVSLNTTTVANGIYNFSATARDAAGNTATSTSFLINLSNIDTNSPTLSILYPTNTSYSTAQTSLNYSASDTNLDNCWYSTDGGSTNTSINDCSSNFTGLIAIEGQNNWTAYANDTTNNVNSSTVRFTQDTVAPAITLPFYANGTLKVNTDTLTLNISVTDATTDESACKVNINGTNQTYAVSSGWCNITDGFLTGLSDGNATIKVYANDTSNNWGENKSYVVKIDTTAPYFTAIVNQSIYSYEILSYDINATDAGVGLGNFSIDDTINFSINSSTGFITNITELVEHYYTVNVTINDTFGNLNWSLWGLNVATYESYEDYIQVFYVSSSTGDDSNDGNSFLAPWETLSKVNEQSFQPGDAILFKKGDSWNETLNVTSSGNSTKPITFGAYGTGNNPILTGFETLSSWSDIGGGIYKSSCSSCGSSVSIVIINGTQYGMGRYPNANGSNGGYLTYESHSGTTSITDTALSSSPNWTGAEAVIRKNRWQTDRTNITNHGGTTLTYTSLGTSWEPTNNFGYFIQNDARTLDVFGEWYFNSTDSTMQIYFGGNNPDNYAINTTTMDYLMFIRGYDYVTLSNLTFKGADKSAMYIRDTQHMIINNCDMDFSGITAVNSYDSSTVNDYLTINNSIFNHSNSNAITVQGDNTTIANTVIENTHLIVGSSNTGRGVLSYGNNLTIEYTNVTNSGYNGIQFHSGNNTRIRNNIINNFCLVTDDGGAIYTSGIGDFGIKISGNNVSKGIGNGNGTSSTASLFAEGIYLDYPSANMEIFSNNVSNCSNTGIFTNVESYNNSIHDNILSNNLDYIYIIGSNNTTIANNTITGNSSHGIFLNAYSNNNSVLNNTIVISAGRGILLVSSEKNKIERNNVTTNADIAVYIYGASNNNNLTNNTAMSVGSSRGIYVTDSNNNILTNNTCMSNSGDGLLIGLSNNTVLRNNTGTSNTSRGVYIYYSLNTSLINQKGLGYQTGSSGIYLTNSNNSLFIDCANISGILYDIYSNAGLNNSFLNCSYNISKETANGTAVLIRKWYLEVNITNSTRSPLEAANVTVYNSTGSLMDSALTNSTGNINKRTITEYTNNGGTRTYETPHTINITKAGYVTNSTAYNVTILNNLKLDVSLTAS